MTAWQLFLALLVNQTRSQPRAAFAKLDLNSTHSGTDLPDTTRQILLTSVDASKPLSCINPYRVGTAMDALCRPVDGIAHQRSGGLLLVAKTLTQAKVLLTTKHVNFTVVPTPVHATVAWSTQLSYGKIYASG